MKRFRDEQQQLAVRASRACLFSSAPLGVLLGTAYTLDIAHSSINNNDEKKKWIYL